MRAFFTIVLHVVFSVLNYFYKDNTRQRFEFSSRVHAILTLSLLQTLNFCSVLSVISFSFKTSTLVLWGIPFLLASCLINLFVCFRDFEGTADVRALCMFEIASAVFYIAVSIALFVWTNSLMHGHVID